MPSNPVDEVFAPIRILLVNGIRLVESDALDELRDRVANVVREQERSRYEGLLALADKWFDTGTSLMAGVPVETDEGLAFTAAHHLGRQGAGAAFIAASTELRAALTPSAPAEKED